MLLLLAGCGFPPVVTGHEDDGQESAEASLPANPDPPMVPLSKGTWLDSTTCNGTAAQAAYRSDFGFNPSVILGTVPLACRPAAGTYKASCTYGDPAIACTVTVDASGVVRLASLTPWHGMTVVTSFVP